MKIILCAIYAGVTGIIFGLWQENSFAGTFAAIMIYFWLDMNGWCDEKEEKNEP